MERNLLRKAIYIIEIFHGYLSIKITIHIQEVEWADTGPTQAATLRIVILMDTKSKTFDDGKIHKYW